VDDPADINCFINLKILSTPFSCVLPRSQGQGDAQTGPQSPLPVWLLRLIRYGVALNRNTPPPDHDCGIARSLLAGTSILPRQVASRRVASSRREPPENGMLNVPKTPGLGLSFAPNLLETEAAYASPLSGKAIRETLP
jgi:hypothetical protein